MVEFKHDPRNSAVSRRERIEPNVNSIPDFERDIAGLRLVLSDFEGCTMSDDHVLRWVSQFPDHHRGSILRELSIAYGQTYFSRGRVQRFVETLAARSLRRDLDAIGFWSQAHVLERGFPGHSQEILRDSLKKELAQAGLRPAASERDATDLVLLDDFLLSGACVLDTLGEWITNDAPPRAHLHLVFMGVHSFGMTRAQVELQRLTKLSGKDLVFSWWHELRLEDHPRAASCDALRPAIYDAQAGARFPRAGKTAAIRRRPTSELQLFSSKDARAAVEAALLEAGQSIMAKLGGARHYVRPLGLQGLPGLGFGTLLTTYRSCPNHAPLAMWFGVTGHPSHPRLGGWYPLLPRSPERQLHELDGLEDRFFRFPDGLESTPPPRSRSLASARN